MLTCLYHRADERIVPAPEDTTDDSTDDNTDDSMSWYSPYIVWRIVWLIVLILGKIWTSQITLFG